jgi:molybdopterin-guanine dinucleotide biosynthesis protein A
MKVPISAVEDIGSSRECRGYVDYFVNSTMLDPRARTEEHTQQSEVKVDRRHSGGVRRRQMALLLTQRQGSYTNVMQLGGVILCGGESKRMGTPKPWLPFGGQTLLARVVQTLQAVVEPVVIVATAGQKLPPVPEPVIVTLDRAAGRGPLEGIAVGLTALAARADAAFLCGCDAALLSPAVVRHLCELLGEHDAVVPVVSGYRQTLTSVCRTSVLPVAEAMLEAGERKAQHLFDRVTTRFIEEDELRTVDSELMSVRAMNTPADYRAALAAAGLSPPNDAVIRNW